MSWLRVLHFIGLTNLSDTEVKSYERRSPTPEGRATAILFSMLWRSVLGSFVRLLLTVSIPWMVPLMVHLLGPHLHIVTPNTRDIMLMVIPLGMLYYVTAFVSMLDLVVRFSWFFVVMLLLPSTILVISQNLLLYFYFSGDITASDLTLVKGIIFTNIVSLFFVDFVLATLRVLQRSENVAVRITRINETMTQMP